MVEEIQVRPPPLFGAAAGAGWTRAGRRPGYGQARPGQGEGHKSVHVGYKLDLATNRAGDGERGRGELQNLPRFQRYDLCPCVFSLEVMHFVLLRLARIQLYDSRRSNPKCITS